MARNGKENLPAGAHTQTTTRDSAPETLDWQAALIDLSFEPIFAWDWEKGIIEWNAGAEKQYGFLRSEVMGKNSHELLATKHPISLRRFLKKLETDGYWIGEVRHTTKDGRELIVESRQQVIVQNGRRVVMESNRDITERRAGEGQVALLIIIGDLIRKLTSAEDLLFAASKAVGQHFKARRCLFNEIDIENDLEIIHRDYRRGVESVAGKHKLSAYSPVTTAEMIAGATVSNANSKTDPRTAKFYKKIYEPAGERSYVAIPLMRDSQWKASLWVSDDQPREWSQAEISLLEVVAERVWSAVEKHQNEAAMRESVQRFAKIFNSSPLAVTITSLKSGKLIDVNNSFAEISGYERSEAVGKTTADLGLWQSSGDRDRQLSALRRDGSVRNSEYVFRNRYGEEIVGLVSAELIEIDGDPCALTVFQDITQRKKAENELRRIAEFDEAVMANMGEGLYTLDAAGLVTTMNPATENLLGWKFQELRGRSMHEVIHHHHRDGRPFPKEECAVVKVLQEGTPIIRQEDLFIRKDGTFFDVIYSSSPLRAQDGSIIGLVVVFQDITQRKKIAAALRESEESYRVLAESASDAIISIDEESMINFVNTATTRIFGYTAGEMKGQPLTMLMPEELRREHRAGFSRYLKTGVRNLNWESIHVPARHKDGRHFPIEISFGEHNRDGKRLFIGIARDITDRKNTEGILERYRLLSERSDDVIWFMRPDGSFVEVNRSAVETYGYTPDEFLKMNVRDLRHPSDIGNFKKQLAAAGSGGIHFETVHMGKDGTPIPVEVNANGSDFGDERLIMAIVRNITERKRADEALRKSEELFSRFMQYLPGLAWIKDVDGKYMYANDGVEKAFGTSRKKLYGKTDDDVFPSPIAGQFKANDGLALEQGTGLQTVETLMHDDGVLHHSLVSKFPIFDADGKTDMIGGMAIDITDRVKAEEALRESEERRKLAQDAGNVGIFDWDIRSGKTYWSETMWSIYGENPSDINPDDTFWSEHLHDHDRERVKRNIKNVLRSGADEFRDEFRIVLRDGSIRWIEARAAVSRDSSGAANRMYGVNTDITSRKEAEEKTRLSDNQLRLVTNAMPALISYVDKDECYRFANHKYTDWFGVPTEEVIGKGPRDIFGADAYAVLKPYIDKALAGERCTFETVLSYKDLGERYVHGSYIPDVGADGTVFGYYGLTQDLTDLKHSEELLRSTEERLGLMMESLTDYAILSIDKEGRIESWNRGAEIMYGYDQKEVIGRHYELVFTPEDIQGEVALQEMKDARLKGKASYEGWRLKKDGSRFYASATLMPLYVGKVLTGYAKIVSDLTEKKRHAEELQRAHDNLEIRVKERTQELAESNAALVQEIHDREISEKHRIDLLGRLVSSQEFERRRIARDLHDQMGQRLTALRLKIASLHEIGPGSDEFIPRVKRLQEISERLDSEVSFLAWELRPTTLDDLGLLDAVAAYVNEWSRHYEISAEFHSAGLPKDRLDREVETHLYRISQEALNNIAKHADAKHVTVLLERRERSLILIIEDDGKGFDPAKKLASRESGKGLGLVGMGERAILIGGEIEIESAPGKSTTIYVRVPFQN